MANIYVLGALPSIHLILMGTRRRVLLLQWLLVNDTWMAKHFPHKNPTYSAANSLVFIYPDTEFVL